MTERKPPDMSFRGWVDYQIQRAQRDGKFDDLPGAGKPIPGLDQPMDHLAWVADKMRRENVSISAALPPSLALPKEIEELPEKIATLWSEVAVREYVQDLNSRIRWAHLRPQEGPPLKAFPADEDETVALWHAQRAAKHAALAEAMAERAAQEPPRRTRFQAWRERFEDGRRAAG